MQNVAIAPQESGFDQFELPHTLMKSLLHMKYTQPTPVQAQAIPAILKGKDILGSAQTGTGKTGAFVIPILSQLMLDPHAHALVMAPTRELAAQILAVVHQMAHGHSAIKTALLIGGESMGRQRAQLSAKPRFIVGTPGRMNDHLRNDPRLFMKTTILVLDEADRMLDMGFAPQIKDIIATTNPKRQTLMFSATFPENIMKFAQQYLRDPFRVAIEPERTSAALIKHEELHTSEGARYGELVRELREREGSIIVFIKTKHGADRMTKKLVGEKLSVDVIHGGLNQRQRDRAIAGFRNGKTRIMIATDVAARGLDVPHIEHVINYDLPQVAEDYVHRIGRTGRNGKEGTALSFIMKSENGKWRAIQRLLNPTAKEERKPRGKGEGRPRPEGGKFKKKDNFHKPERFRPNLDAMSLDEAMGGEGEEVVEFNRPAKAFQDKKPPFKKRFDKPRGEGNFKPREDRQEFEGTSEDRPFRKPYGDKPRFDNKKRFDKPRGEGNFKPREDRGDFEGNREDRPFRKPYGDKPRFDNKKRFDKPRGEGNFKPREDRGDFEGNREDRPFRKPYGDKPRFDNKKRFDKPRGEGNFKPREDRGDFEGNREDRPFRKPYGDKPRFDNKKRFDKPRGEGNFKPREDREANGNYRPKNPDAPHASRKPYSDKPRGNGGFKKKPFFKRRRDND